MLKPTNWKIQLNLIGKSNPYLLWVPIMEINMNSKLTPGKSLVFAEGVTTLVLANTSKPGLTTSWKNCIQKAVYIMEDFILSYKYAPAMALSNK